MKKNKYNFYPFTSDILVWHEDNKAIIKLKNPLHDCSSIKCQGFYYCGYVLFKKNEVPKSWRNGNYSVDHIDMLMIHGGLTYGRKEGDYVVFGFDTNHAEDDENPDLQNLDYIIKITQQTEDQLKIHADNIEEYRKLKSVNAKAAYLDEIREKAKYKVALNYIGMFCFGATDE